VARKTVIPEIAERERPVLPVEWYAKLLAGLETARDRAIFLIACFCALRPSELFGLTWNSYQGNVFVIANTAWRGRLQRKKIKRKNRFGQTNFSPGRHTRGGGLGPRTVAAQCPGARPDALMFPGTRARGRGTLDTPMFPDNWQRLHLYPIAKKLGIPFHPTFQVLRRSFSPTARKRRIPPKCKHNWGTATSEPR